MSANERAAANQGIYLGNKFGVVGHPSQRKIGKKQRNKITLTRLQVVLILIPQPLTQTKIALVTVLYYS
jgi:hypothetical protein